MGCGASTPANNGAEARDKKATSPDTPKKMDNQLDKTEEEQLSTEKKTDIKQTLAAAPPDKDHVRLVLGDNTTIRYAVVSRKGKDPDDKSKCNQDSYSVNENFVGEGSALFGVYDGHGPDGAPCAQFVRKRLPELIRTNTKFMMKQKQKATTNSRDQIHFALQQAHVDCNDELHAEQDINDKYSGTTAISVFFHDEGESITISNVGDSRLVLGTEVTPGQITAVPLSKDQTPHRSEEAGRCIQAGARILSLGQIDPQNHQQDDDGSVLDEDPPRVWSKKGTYPGTAFTRSLGDSIAESLGVYAEPELLTVSLTHKEKVIVLASDGIFDVMNNQQVVDLCHTYYHDAKLACQALIEECHKQWLLNEDCFEHEDAASYDDMTAICIFLGDVPITTATTVEIGDSGEPVGATTNEDDNRQAEASSTQDTRHPRRRRQKTLHNLEEWASETAEHDAKLSC